MTEIMVSSKPLTAGELKGALAPASDLKQRMEGKRSLVVEMEMGKPTNVRFEGFWNNMFIKGAFNSISKAYRLQRARPGHKPAEEGGRR